MATTVLSAQALATELGTDSRTVRKFLRSVTPKENQPGKGSRWGIEKKNLRGLRKQFASWTAEHTPPVADTPVEDTDAPVED